MWLNHLKVRTSLKGFAFKRFLCKCADQVGHSYATCRNEKWYHHLGKQFGSFSRSKKYIYNYLYKYVPYDPVISCLHIYLRETKAYIKPKTWTQIPKAGLYVTGKNWSKSNAHQWWIYKYTVVYLYNGILFSNKNRVNLKIILLSERNSRKYFFIFSDKKHMSLLNRGMGSKEKGMAGRTELSTKRHKEPFEAEGCVRYLDWDDVWSKLYDMCSLFHGNCESL